MKEITNKTTKFNSSNQTPIEIALQIDENGMTTASNLYTFLELHPASFSRWCNTNIKNNKFAVENEDYIPFNIHVERNNPKPKTDYKLTSEFAKKLSMTGNTYRHELARDYFIACEQGLKVATKKLQTQPQIDIHPLMSAISTLSELVSTMQHDIHLLKESHNKINIPEKRYSRWKTNTFNKLEALLVYVNQNSENSYKLSEIIHLIIQETEIKFNIEVNEYVDAYKSEYGLDKTPYTIDVINHYKDIRDMFTQTLDLIMEKLHISTNSTDTKTIFDVLAEQNNH